ncbi:MULTISPECIES: cupredoxin domain-containing protein [unclassified Mycobacterium]|uniref:cupredoxin domain-containing protein n=1 Tax=unclassified Mycobacterium TaxID=2642494 RepID=UPI0029C97DEF|nr:MULTISPECIES: cupredoxin domain-containing protein [unclassified Mycobacterium]
MTKLFTLLSALCLMAALVACGSSGTEASQASTATATGSPSSSVAAEATITISGMKFGDPVTVAPGATIEIVNDDTAEHSVTSQTEGQFDTHVDGGAKKTFTAPTQPGEYAFYCVYHPNMKGTLIVK